jgi:hypothetical protein
LSLELPQVGVVEIWVSLPIEAKGPWDDI